MSDRAFTVGCRRSAKVGRANWDPDRCEGRTLRLDGLTAATEAQRCASCGLPMTAVFDLAKSISRARRDDEG